MMSCHALLLKQSRPRDVVVTLRPVNLRWIQGAEDDPVDLCAHGDIEFRIGDDVLLGRDTGKDLTVSAAALYLLRALERPHTRDAPVGDHLFPCCGFAMFEMDGEPDVVVCGCSNGEDFEVLHGPDGVVVQTATGRTWSVSWPEWREAVFAFADRVAAFYAACSPKRPAPDDVTGFRCFAREWERRRGAPGPVAP